MAGVKCVGCRQNVRAALALRSFHNPKLECLSDAPASNSSGVMSVNKAIFLWGIYGAGIAR